MSDVAQRGRIGPNAVIRLAEALDALESRSVTTRLFAGADLEAYVLKPPEAMVPEDDVTLLHRTLRHQLSPARAASVSWLAGIRTADYLLGHRIPRPVQYLLKRLPRRLSAFILLKAIGAHAWTFAGSSRFTWTMGRPVILTFEDCPLCRHDRAAEPCCSYYAATFERLFRTLLSPDTAVRETACIATGSEACRFEVSY